MIVNLRTRTAALAVLAPLLLTTVSACGGNDSSTNDFGSGSSTESPSQGAPTSFDAYQLAFAECMREQGVDMPDPDDSGAQLNNGGDPDAFAAAAQTCQDELGQPPAPDGDSVGESNSDLQARNLKIAECLRENGVDVEDPQPDGSLDVPADAPFDVVAKCAPGGVVGQAGPGGQ
jgi:hypothetical protein